MWEEKNIKTCYYYHRHHQVDRHQNNQWIFKYVRIVLCIHSFEKQIQLWLSKPETPTFSWLVMFVDVWTHPNIHNVSEY